MPRQQTRVSVGGLLLVAAVISACGAGPSASNSAQQAGTSSVASAMAPEDAGFLTAVRATDPSIDTTDYGPLQNDSSGTTIVGREKLIEYAKRVCTSLDSGTRRFDAMFTFFPQHRSLTHRN